MADLKRRIIAEFSAKNKAKGAMAGFRKDMDDTGKSMMRMAKGAMAMVGVGGGLYAAKRGFDYMTNAAMKQEDALFLLEAALRATGEYTDEIMKKYEAFGASIQKATIYGDEEVLALMQLMKSLGVTSNALEQATRMAIGLAAATGRDVKSMSMYIALAQQGEFTMLRRYIPALRSTTDATEQLRIITEFAANGFKIAEAQAETASGAFKQMWNAVSDLAEVMGQPFIDTMAKDAERATTNIEILTEALKKQKKSVEELIKSEGRLKYMPIGVPFYAPTMPKDISKWYEKPSEREPLAGQLADQTWAMKQLSEEYKIQKQVAGEAATMEQHRIEMLEKGGTLQAMQFRQETERIRLEIERSEKLREQYKLVIEEKVIAAAAAAEEEIKIAEEATKKMEARTYEFIMNFQSIIASGLERTMRDWENWKEGILDMLEEVYWAAIRMAFLEPFAGMLAKGLTGALGAVLGPGIFATATPPAEPVFVSPHGGPALQYGGLVEKTGWAKVHRGEKYSGVGGGGGNLDVHIHNEGEGKLEISEVEEYAISDQRIIDVIIRAAAEYGPYRRSIKQIK